MDIWKSDPPPPPPATDEIRATAYGAKSARVWVDQETGIAYFVLHVGALAIQGPTHKWQAIYDLLTLGLAQAESHTTSKELTSAEEFFYANACSSYDPKTETEEQGRRRSARKLAQAEKWAQANGYTFEWPADDEASQESGQQEYGCIMRCKHGEVAQSLWAIGFEDYGPPCDPYKRVVEAELALEEMP